MKKSGLIGDKKVMNRVLIFVYIILLSCVISPDDSLGQKGAERYSLAVLNFQKHGNSLFYSDVRFLTGEFIAELNKANLFHTMSQVNMERGLIDKNIDPNSGCDEMKCALKTASALGVQLVIIGSLGEEDDKFKLEVKMIHAVSQKVVKTQSAKYAKDLSQVYYDLNGFTSDFLGIPRKPQVKQEEPVRPLEKSAGLAEPEIELPYNDFNYVEEDTTEFIDTGAVYFPSDGSEAIDTGAIYYPKENKLKKVLYWGLAAAAIGGVSASIIILSGGASGGGGNPSNDLPDPPAFQR